LGTCPSVHLIISKSPLLGLISSSLDEEEEAWEDVFLEGEGEEECSLSTSPLAFMVMVLLEGQLEAMCAYPKHIKHLIELDLCVGEEC